ncbi:MAG: L,D-transpeptidase family protein, partial [Verrucomicrobia bacterium]|nr:L,D-transpeptidase family protein [Verrucomicrobiota bacterium]
MTPAFRPSVFLSLLAFCCCALLALTGCGSHPPQTAAANGGFARTRGHHRGSSEGITPATANAFASIEAATQLQVFLDKENFGPGKIDGRGGEFTRKALARYGRAHGLGANLTTADADLARRVPGLANTRAFTDYTVTAADAAQIGTIPDSRAEQGKARSLPYTSLLELLGEKFHAERAFLQKLNPGKNLASLRVGDTVRVPAVDAPLDVPALPQHGKLLAPKPQFASRTVKINTREKLLDLFDADGRLLATFPITPGSAALPAPPGTWKIVNMASLPYFRYDESMLNYGVRSENFVNLPPGPNSPVGVLWMGLNKPGIGLHGTNNPETIGRAASHGCIRLANWDAVKLSGMVTQGM